MEGGLHTHWLVDIQGELVVVQPCCLAIAEDLATYGYEAVVGRSLEEVLREIRGVPAG